MGKNKLDHGGVHNGVRSRLGRRHMSDDAIEGQIAHFSMRVIAFKSDRDRLEQALIEQKQNNSAQLEAAAHAYFDARDILARLQREAERRVLKRNIGQKRRARLAAKIMRPLLSKPAQHQVTVVLDEWSNLKESIDGEKAKEESHSESGG
jgi:hypothetical protein